MTEKNIFQEKEQLAGHVVIDSGSLLITDGIWDANGISQNNKLKLDLGEDKVLKVPVTTMLQNGRRFVILDIDAAVGVEAPSDTVETEEPAELPKEPEDTEEEEGTSDGLRIPQE